MKKIIFLLIIVMFMLSCGGTKKSEINLSEKFVGDWVLYKINNEVSTIDEMKKMINDKNILILKKSFDEILYEKESMKLVWNDSGYMKLVGYNGMDGGKMYILDGILHEEIYGSNGGNYKKEYKRVSDVLNK